MTHIQHTRQLVFCLIQWGANLVPLCTLDMQRAMFYEEMRAKTLRVAVIRAAWNSGDRHQADGIGLTQTVVTIQSSSARCYKLTTWARGSRSPSSIFAASVKLSFPYIQVILITNINLSLPLPCQSSVIPRSARLIFSRTSSWNNFRCDLNLLRVTITSARRANSTPAPRFMHLFTVKVHLRPCK